MVSVYVLKRSLGSALVLHPFVKKPKVIQDLERDSLEFAYAQPPTDDDRSDALYWLYASVDAAVDSWVQELKYIPRLLWSALAFLLTYWFTALVIRLPVPLIDEILFSSLAAVLVYLFVAKKNTKSEIAMKRRIELKRHVDSASDRTEDDLHPIQEALAQLEAASPFSLANMICGFEPFPLLIPVTTVSRETGRYLGLYLGEQKRYAKLLRLLPPSSGHRRSQQISARLLRLGNSGKIDLPLLALYRLLQFNQT